jgi:hypothetical protein
MVEKMHFGSNNPARYCHHFASVITLSCFLLWKESLNSDGQQFDQYQQSEQSALTYTIEHEKATTYDVGNQDPG